MAEGGSEGVTSDLDGGRRCCWDCCTASEELISTDIAAALLDDDTLVVQLTTREREVVRHLAEGLPRKLIGRCIGERAAESAVTTHLNRSREVSGPGAWGREQCRAPAGA